MHDAKFEHSSFKLWGTVTIERAYVLSAFEVLHGSFRFIGGSRALWQAFKPVSAYVPEHRRGLGVGVLINVIGVLITELGPLDFSTALEQEVACGLISEHEPVSSFSLVDDTACKSLFCTPARAVRLALSRGFAGSADRTMKVVRKMSGHVLIGNGLGLPIAARLSICPIFFIISFCTVDSRSSSRRTASSALGV